MFTVCVSNRLFCVQSTLFTIHDLNDPNSPTKFLTLNASSQVKELQTIEM